MKTRVVMTPRRIRMDVTPPAPRTAEPAHADDQAALRQAHEALQANHQALIDARAADRDLADRVIEELKAERDALKAELARAREAVTPPAPTEPPAG